MEEIKKVYLSEDEWSNIAKELEIYHGIFSILWRIGKPVLTESEETASVSFDENGEYLSFQLNFDFWKSLSLKQKCFVICHECLHLMFNHGIRTLNLDPDMRKVANIALDIAVNESLIRDFGFIKKEIDPDLEFYWVENTFPKEQNISKRECFEFYYNLLNKSKKQYMFNHYYKKLVDNHKNIPHEYKKLKELFDEVSKNISDKEKEHIQNIIENSYRKGEKSGNLVVFVKTGNVKKKKKWESVIKNWFKKVAKQSDNEQWVRLNRRLSILDSNLFLPSDMEIEELDKSKIEVWFFQDTSGSCYYLRERFLRAAKSLPTDRFKVRFFCFDTTVEETDLDSGRLRGFLGTSFSALENKIQEEIKGDIKKYPKAVFVVTDGFGDRIKPAKPERWFWFLTSYYKQFIPERSHVFMLKDFE